MRSSLPKDRPRVVLEGPSCRMWFLGERTIDYQLTTRRRIPQDPPLDMFWAHGTDDDEIATYRAGFPSGDLFVPRAKNYHGFILRECLGTLPLDDRMIAEVMTLSFFSDCNNAFYD